MLELNASDFYSVVTILQRAQGHLAGDVKNEASVFHENKIPEPSPVVTSLLERLVQLNESLVALDAKVTKMQVDRIIEKVETQAWNWGRIYLAIEDLDVRLMDELTLRKLLVIATADEGFYSPATPLFGPAFATKFRTQGAFELDEAAKCIAFGRPTAAAFHFMRVMEIAIQAFAKCLQIPDPTKPADRNWGNILKEIKKGVDAKWPTAASRMNGDGQLFEELSASLDAAKNPWRNSTMHVEKKYTDDEAQHIFAAVKGFMKKLSDRMDEDGKPFA